MYAVALCTSFPMTESTLSGGYSGLWHFWQSCVTGSLSPPGLPLPCGSWQLAHTSGRALSPGGSVTFGMIPPASTNSPNPWCVWHPEQLGSLRKLSVRNELENDVSECECAACCHSE